MVNTLLPQCLYNAFVVLYFFFKDKWSMANKEIKEISFNEIILKNQKIKRTYYVDNVLDGVGICEIIIANNKTGKVIHEDKILFYKNCKKK